ncbi:sce7726 family protein [Clavibacter seminis]|uniref:Sce7726 family protein n=2 Tax=Clavibacter TaxID=1573 RepID=A0ABY3TA28_9MICO|nr:sce7726 family protein [Clavibacter sp. A6099]
MLPVTESELRELVRATVRSEMANANVQSNHLFVDEFVLGERGRIDLAVIGERFQGFELKSDLDTLSRLPRQMKVYSEIFDYCTLVITPRHLKAARAVLWRGWGLSVVSRIEGEGLSYKRVRKPTLTTRVESVPLASLLWRDEALKALDSLGHSTGLRSKPRDVLWQRLAEVTTGDDLRKIVSSAITARQGWRDGRELRECDATPQSSGVSSRFLARRFLPQSR